MSFVLKAAASKLGFLFRTRRFFIFMYPTLYNTQIRPCLEYGSPLWRGAFKHSFTTLVAIQMRMVRLIANNSIITNTLDSLSHRRNASALSHYYRNYPGFCSDKVMLHYNQTNRVPFYFLSRILKKIENMQLITHFAH